MELGELSAPRIMMATAYNMRALMRARGANICGEAGTLDTWLTAAKKKNQVLSHKSYVGSITFLMNPGLHTQMDIIQKNSQNAAQYGSFYHLAATGAMRLQRDQLRLHS